MSGLKHADNFRDLIIYQKSRQLQMFCGDPARTLRQDSAIYFAESEDKEPITGTADC